MAFFKYTAGCGLLIGLVWLMTFTESHENGEGENDGDDEGILFVVVVIVLVVADSKLTDGRCIAIMDPFAILDRLA